MKQYIIESASRAQKQQRDFLLHNRIIVTVTEPLQNDVNVKKVLKDVQRLIPDHLLSDVDSVYIGDYEPLKARQVQSLFINGTILISNDMKDDKELFATIIHEIGHAVEEIAKDFLYSDGRIAKEFLAKRKTLYNLLKDDYKINPKSFLNINFDTSFDNFIYKSIGYDNLGVITNGLFLSPYACTSLREYFANGFEHYFLKDDGGINEVSPILYKKIKLILKPDYNN